jgi:hypothetical protein
MLYKPDFEAAHQRLQAFWEHDCLGRCALQVVARSADYRPIDEDGVDLLTRRTDIDYVLDRAELGFRNHCYLAEAVPVYVPGLVCSDIAAYLVQDIGLRADTVWYPRTIAEWAEDSLSFDQSNRWWQLTRRMAQAGAARGRGKYLIGIPDFQPAMDIVSLLRSPDKLCVDLIENPERVKKATHHILHDVYAPCYAQVRSIIAEHSEYVSDWLGLIATGRHDIVQCDFCALVSTKHFAEFCLPDIAAQCRMLDTSIFHLDGPGAVHHLDTLLEIGALDAIQWTPGAGQAPAVAWLPMLKKVQQAGKSLWINSPPEDVPGIMQSLSPRGLLIAIDGVFASDSEADSFIHQVERACTRANARGR